MKLTSKDQLKILRLEFGRLDGTKNNVSNAPRIGKKVKIDKIGNCPVINGKKFIFFAGLSVRNVGYL